MKTIHLIAVAAAGVMTLAVGAHAGDLAMSPRAKAQADSLKTVAATTTDTIDRSIQSGSPRAKALAESQRTVPSDTMSVDLAHGPRPSMSPKDPRYEQAARELRQPQYQIAPLK
jgi:hypothetical protein